MGRGKKIEISGKIFNTQNEAFDFVRSLLMELESSKFIDNSSEHWHFFSNLLARHSDYEEKNGLGIKKFLIGRNFKNDIELNLERVDGSKVDVSWRKCVTGKATPIISNLKAAMRVEIDDQITDFKNKTFYKGMICTECNVAIDNIDDCHCDHINHFEIIADIFIRQNFNHPIDFDDQPVTNKATFKTEDCEYAKKWSAYHQQTASLRLIHANCNLTRKKAR